MSCLRKAALTTAMLLMWGGHAIAADAVVEEVVVDTAYDWSGVYIGLQGGYGWADADFTIFTNPETNFTVDADGPFVGGYVGYNFQWDNFVAGIEGDINASWIDEDDAATGDIDIDWFASIRGRIGYAWDRTMFFGTAGVAFAHADASAVLVAGTDNDLDFTGWTAGLGIEHAFTENWLVRAEYRHYDFGSEDILRGEVDLDMDTVSAGIAYKF